MKGFQPYESLPHFVLREVDCLRAMEGREGIIQLLDVYHQPKGVFSRQGSQIKFVFPFCEYGDLLHFMKHRSQQMLRLSLEMILDVVEQIITALKVIHSKGYIHRDVKPANILVQDFVEGRIRVALADFGLSRSMSCPPQAMTKQI